MIISINRPDLITKKKICSILKHNKLSWVNANQIQRVTGWNECIDQMIEVLNRKEI